jgi:N6-adenosine-specific RNA methylase IME4
MCRLNGVYFFEARISVKFAHDIVSMPPTHKVDFTYPSTKERELLCLRVALEQKGRACEACVSRTP